MNIEVQNLDSLRKLVRDLQKENKILKEKLKKANISFAETHIFEEKIEDTAEYDPDQGARIIGKILRRKWQIIFSRCSGEEQMYMPGEERMVGIFHSVIIDGIIEFVPGREGNR